MIDKVTLAVASMDKMVAFYSHVLGVDFEAREMFGHVLHSGHWKGIELLLCPKDLAGVDADINTIQLRFQITDLAAAHARGLAQGGVSLNEPGSSEGVLSSALRDPDGNSLELIECGS